MIFTVSLITLLSTPFLLGILLSLFIKPHLNYTHTPALLFHSVNRSKENGLSHIDPNLFENLLQELSNHNIETVTITEAFSDNRTGNKVALIFDDGFEDFYQEAFPLLKRYKCTATLFPVTQSIGNDYSWDLYSHRPNLTSEQIKEISDYGIEIGSHTHSHPDLTRINDNELKNELSKSKETLEKITQKAVTSLSFPFGSWNRRVWRTAKTSGYLTASAYRGLKHSENDILNVIGVYSFDSITTLRQKCGLESLERSTYITSAIMPHFAKGTALWNFRKGYSLFSK